MTHYCDRGEIQRETKAESIFQSHFCRGDSSSSLTQIYDSDEGVWCEFYHSERQSIDRERGSWVAVKIKARLYQKISF